MRSLLVLILACSPGLAAANALDHLRTTDDIGLNKVPHEGVSRILVVPSRVGVDDFPAGRLADLQAFFDPDGGEFREYWQIVSNGRYDPVPTVVDPVLYTDSCPIPGRTLANCSFDLGDIDLVLTGAVGAAFADVLERVRDEQGIDLAIFDDNGVDGEADGYFDGVILDTDLYSGVAFPFAALGNTVVVDATLGGAPITCGIAALVPPEFHEFGHTFGFIDLYGGPAVADLMADIDATLGAFSRQQIGWADVVEDPPAGVIELAPVLDGGEILRFGAPPRYVLVENRGGAHHDALEGITAGLYVHSVDEDELPTTALGFLDIASGELYLANAAAPYLYVTMPVGCGLYSSGEDACAVRGEGTELELEHASGTALGVLLILGATATDGTITLTVVRSDSGDDDTTGDDDATGDDDDATGDDDATDDDDDATDDDDTTDDDAIDDDSADDDDARNDDDSSGDDEDDGGCRTTAGSPWVAFVMLGWWYARRRRGFDVDPPRSRHSLP